MAVLERQTHWDGAYQRNGATKVSWFQTSPALSLQLIDSIGVYNLWEDNAFKDGHPVVADHRLMESWVFRDKVPEPERRRRATA